MTLSRLPCLTALALLAGPTGPAGAQAPPSEVRLETSDGVTVFGDVYRTSVASELGFLLLFHQGGGDARGEYGPLVPRLLEAGFDVLAIDQRRGGTRFDGENRTLAGIGDTEYGYCDVLPDLEAALDHVRSLEPNGRPVLWGSSYSGALVIQLAARRPDEVAGVIAFSPASGEPMDGCRPEGWSQELAVPLLVLRPASEAEIPSVADQLDTFRTQDHQTWVADPGVHGSSMLNPDRVEGDVEPTWTVVLTFLETLPR